MRGFIDTADVGIHWTMVGWLAADLKLSERSDLLFIYLATPGLSCSTWDLLAAAFELLVAACGI